MRYWECVSVCLHMGDVGHVSLLYPPPLTTSVGVVMIWIALTRRTQMILIGRWLFVIMQVHTHANKLTFACIHAHT